MGLECEVGLRRRTYNVLSGSVLSIWNRIEVIIAKNGQNAKMQVVRLRTAEGIKIVGQFIWFIFVVYICIILFTSIKTYWNIIFATMTQKCAIIRHIAGIIVSLRLITLVIKRTIICVFEK